VSASGFGVEVARARKVTWHGVSYLGGVGETSDRFSSLETHYLNRYRLYTVYWVILVVSRIILK